MDYLPSTRRLLDLLMHREWGPPKDEAEARGPYTVDACLAEWEEGALAASLSKDELNGAATWPADPELLEALRAALLDQRGNYAGERLAFALVRCGCREPATLTALNRWDALPFRWHAAGLSAATILGKLREAGMAGAVPDADLAKLDAWLADPASAITRRAPGHAGSILLQEKMVTMALYDNGGEVRYKELLEGWASSMSPPLVLQNLVQKSGDTILKALPADVFVSVTDILPAHLKENQEFTLSETFWKLSFACNGKSFEFFVPGDYTHLNDGALAAEFKLLLRRLRRPERVHRLAEVRAASPTFWGNYVVADPAKVFPLCASLGIPLQEMRSSVR